MIPNQSQNDPTIIQRGIHQYPKMVQIIVEYHKNMVIPSEYHIDSKQVQDRFKVISKIFESQFQIMALIGERGGDGRTFQESFHIMCLGQGLDGKG